MDPINYMKMYNQALLARNPDATPQYSVERIERTGSPSYPSWVYPANDWYDIMFHDYSINHRAGLNIRGGSRLVQYYTSVNYVRDEGMLKTDRLNQFKCNIENSTFSFRTNLNIDLSAGIRLNINTSANLDKYRVLMPMYRRPIIWLLMLLRWILLQLILQMSHLTGRIFVWRRGSKYYQSLFDFASGI